MMFTAAGSNSLDQLIQLIEYVKDPKKRSKELTELQYARDVAISERRAVEKAHGGAKMLDEAEHTLSEARTQASNILSAADAQARATHVATVKKVGILEEERVHFNAASRALNNEVISFNKTSDATIKELERRENKVTKRENDIARSRAEVTTDRRHMQEKAERVTEAMKG